MCVDPIQHRQLNPKALVRLEKIADLHILRAEADGLHLGAMNTLRSLADSPQVQKSFFGMGPALMEEMVFENGKIVNTNLDEYQIPTFLDVPGELGSDLLEMEGSEIEGIGEMSLPPVAPAIANAIFNAVGVRIYDLPVTPEKVLRALEDGNG